MGSHNNIDSTQPRIGPIKACYEGFFSPRHSHDHPTLKTLLTLHDMQMKYKKDELALWHFGH